MKQCKRCGQFKDEKEFSKHLETHDKLRPECKDCRCKIEKERRENNPVRYKIMRDMRKEKNPQIAIMNRERVKKWRIEHPDKREAWHEANKEKNAIRAKKYQETHKDVIAKMHHDRRARIIGNGGTHTDEEWRALCNKYGNKCLCCKKETKLTRDHIVPLSKGGTNDISNIQPLCLKCNMKKKTSTIDYRTS